MGWFDTNRKTGTEAAVAAIQPIMGMAQHHFGTLAGIWRDPYVLGFMIRTFTHYAKLATKGKISASDLSRVYANAFSQLSNLNGAEITRLASKLRQDQDLDFNRGVDDAAALACYKLRTLKDEQNHPLVAKATRVAQANYSSMERSQIAVMMIVFSFMREIEERFH
jgi:hypothetical protein